MGVGMCAHRHTMVMIKFSRKKSYWAPNKQFPENSLVFDLPKVVSP